AGKGENQDLDMMKSEKWFVPLGRLDALLKAAAEKGVRVSRLEENSNWALVPMAEGETMSSKQKNMMKKAMQSKAAMGVRMMKSPAPDVLDYTLTKDVDAEHPEAPPSLVIPLNDKTVVTVRRTSVTKTPYGYEWHGVIEGTGELVTLLCWPGGRLAGTINYRGRTFVLKYMGGQMHAIVELAPEKLPPEHGPAGKGRMQKMNMREDPLVRQGDASMMTPNAGPVPSMKMKPADLAAAPEESTITLIVAYTKNAANNYFDIEKDLIDVAIAEANQSFRTSGIDNVRLKVVHAYETDYVEDGSHFDHVYRFRDKGDGYMDEVHTLRDKHGADVGILIVDDPMGCGLSIRIAGAAKDAFAAMHQECAATMHTLSHEIGHLVGARHDRALDDTLQPFPYGHGFVNGTDWRTIMSYKDSCDGCERRPVWSSPNVKVEGVTAGDANTNNARVIEEQARRVAGFRSSTARADR
ncbi:MAG: hypothetical protein KAQ88_00070, partial [Hyphomicrobiaceae bacterium]|nr:hypothetical protein [Hyphomicrobiaceae bacterium]